jgi:hypothetical protein
MSTLFPDTHPEAEAVLIRLLREAPPWRKLEMVWEMNEVVKTMLISRLKERYPNDPPEIIRRRMADLLLGLELALKVYGPLEEQDMGASLAKKLNIEDMQKRATELVLAGFLQKALAEIK